MATHVKTLGVLHIIFGGLGVAAALVVLFLFGGLAGVLGMIGEHGSDQIAAPILGGIGGIVFCVILVLSLPGLIAGIGLLEFKPWARTLTIVLSVFDLIHVPFGTALGIYGLWVLLSRDTEQLFLRPAAQIART